jgi:hypothetical protein
MFHAAWSVLLRGLFYFYALWTALFLCSLDCFVFVLSGQAGDHAYWLSISSGETIAYVIWYIMKIIINPGH